MVLNVTDVQNAVPSNEESVKSANPLATICKTISDLVSGIFRSIEIYFEKRALQNKKSNSIILISHYIAEIRRERVKMENSNDSKKMDEAIIGTNSQILHEDVFNSQTTTTAHTRLAGLQEGLKQAKERQTKINAELTRLNTLY